MENARIGTGNATDILFPFHRAKGIRIHHTAVGSDNATDIRTTFNVTKGIRIQNGTLRVVANNAANIIVKSVSVRNQVHQGYA